METDTSTNEYMGWADVHEHGFVALEEMMGSELSIVNAARVSFNQKSQVLSERDQGLINFLIRERHSTPLERITFSFVVKCPLFVAREWMRHRLASYNEWSARYSEIDEEFYVPAKSHVREQHGKPGDYFFEPIEDPKIVDEARYLIDYQQREAFRSYHRMLEMGVAKEVARTVLPVGMMTKFSVTMNLRSLLNFLSLRNEDHAQLEIREFAQAVEDLVTIQIPYVMECWNNHGRQPI